MTNIDVTTVVIMGLFFVIVSVAVLAISFFTIAKVKKVREYCTKRFDKIEEIIQLDNKNKDEITELLKTVRGYLKKQNY